ncbi:MAG TPA: hypothetical protein VMS55_08840, partial [Myxococcota bacterium]|nr:hypothetical protein [Myxococcota bacterium]
MGDERFDRAALRRAVLLDWLQQHSPVPLPGVLIRAVSSADIGPETVAAIEEIVARDPSLSYALGMVDVVVGAEEGSADAVTALGRLTGRDWVARYRAKALALRAPAEDSD